MRIVNNDINEKDKKGMIAIIEKLEKRGAKGIVLGCTDLPLLLSDQDVDMPVINTTQILEDAAVDQLIGKLEQVQKV